MSVEITPVDAAPGYTTMITRSYHFHRVHKHNEANTGFGYEWKISDTKSDAVGCYDNSYYRTSCYAIRIIRPWQVGTWKLGYMYGLVTGYDHVVDPWLTAVGTHHISGKWSVNIIVHPAMVAAQLRYKWK